MTGGCANVITATCRCAGTGSGSSSSVASRWDLDHFIGGVFIGGLPLEDLTQQDFAWQEGWEYRVSPAGGRAW